MREALFDLVMLAADCWRMSIFVEKSSTIVSLHATNYGESCAIPASHRVFSWAGYDAMLVWMAFHARVDLPLRAFGIAMAERVYYDPTRQRELIISWQVLRDRNKSHFWTFLIWYFLSISVADLKWVLSI